MSLGLTLGLPGLRYSASAAAISAAATLAAGESEVFAIDFTDDFFQGTTGFYGSAYTLDTGTPANNYSSSPDETASSLLSFTAPSLKMCRQVDGYLSFQAHNLHLYSEDFTNGTWNVASIMSADVAVAPDGTSTADAIIEDGTLKEHSNFDNIGVTQGGTYEVSICVKAGTRSWFGVAINNAANTSQYFNLSNGTKGTTGSSVLSSAITDIGGGWYKVSVEAVASGTSHGIKFWSATADSGSATYTGTLNDEAVYVWGAHIRRTPSVDTYMKTTSAARYALPLEWDVSNNPLGLLVEEARTNSAVRSSDWSTGWTLAGFTQTANATTSPTGLTDASALVEDSGTAQHRAIQTIVTTAASWTASVYLKAGTRNWAYLVLTDNGATARRVWFDLQNGVVGTQETGMTGRITNAGNGWWRCEATIATAAASGQSVQINAASADNTANYTGIASDIAIYAWQYQLELGAFVTSPIPTLGSTVARAADDISKATSEFPLSNGLETIFVQARYANNSGTRLFFDSLGSGNYNRLLLAKNQASVFVTGGNTANLAVGTPSVDTVFKQAAAYAVDDFAAVLNGGTVLTDTTVAVGAGTRTTIHIGSQPGGVNNFNGYIQKVMYLPRRMSDADMQTLTT